MYAFINSTFFILQANLKNKPFHIKVIQDYDQLPLVYCYPSGLNQVLMNIIIRVHMNFVKNM